jgi:hypothetical protein
MRRVTLVGRRSNFKRVLHDNLNPGRNAGFEGNPFDSAEDTSFPPDRGVVDRRDRRPQRSAVLFVRNLSVPSFSSD